MGLLREESNSTLNGHAGSGHAGPAGSTERRSGLLSTLWIYLRSIVGVFGRSRRNAGARPGGIPIRPFSLIRWFTLSGLAAITLTSIASGVILSRFLTENMLQRDSLVTAEFVRGIIHEANREHALQPHHTTVSALDHLLRGDPHESTAQLQAFFALIAAMPDVLHTNVYDARRQIVWSSRKKLVGKSFVDNHELDEALSGEIEIEIGVAGTYAGQKAEHAIFGTSDMRFVENYIPIWNDAGNKVIAVAEIYKSPESLFAAIDTGRRIVWGGAVVGSLVLFLAIFSIARRADRLIRGQQERLIEAETYATVGELAMAVAHGLRNPLAAIRSSAELAIEDDPPESLQEPLSDIIQQADRLEGSVRQLLEYSRRGNESTELVDLGVIAADCLLSFHAQANEKKVNVDARMADALPAVRADAAALAQAINSIIANGLEAMPNGGELNVECASTHDGNFVQLRVADNGYGIPKGQKVKLFEPFATTKSAGLGLGLTLARRILERHGGSLDLSSRAEGGAVATLLIPVVRGA